MSNHVKPKKANPIVSASRMVLLVEPWLTYRQVHEKNMTKCEVGTVTVYGPAIREEIGCELRTEGGRETLVVDYPKYTAACKLYRVTPRSEEDLLAQATTSRPIKIKGHILLDDLQPPSDDATQAMHEAARRMHEALHERISALASRAKPDDFVGIPVNVGEELTRRVEAAELRCTEANDRVKQLEVQLSEARKEADEAAQALKILDELAAAPIAVIRAILG